MTRRLRRLEPLDPEAVHEFVFRHYGPGTVTGPLLDASPQAAAAAGIAWLVTTTFLALVGIALVHLFRGSVS